MSESDNGVRVRSIQLDASEQLEAYTDLRHIDHIEEGDILLIDGSACEIWIGGRRFGCGELMHVEDAGATEFGIRFAKRVPETPIASAD